MEDRLSPGSYIWVVDRGDTRLPFSKFVTASSMMVVGVEPENAYAIGEAVEERLRLARATEVGVDELIEINVETIETHLGSDLAQRYGAWVRARRLGRPIIVLIGGAPGVGKSSVAGQVGARLRIAPVIPTDAVREVMRQLVPSSLSPLIHVSSFEAHAALNAPVASDHDAVIVGFQQQAEIVRAGVRGLIDRAIVERSDLVVEGVHMLPGLFDRELPHWQTEATVCQAILSVPDAESHRAHFLTRMEHSSARRANRYLDSFNEVRRIDRYIQEVAQRTGVPVFPMAQLDEAIQQVMSVIVGHVIAENEGVLDIRRTQPAIQHGS